MPIFVFLSRASVCGEPLRAIVIPYQWREGSYVTLKSPIFIFFLLKLLEWVCIEVSPDHSTGQYINRNSDELPNADFCPMGPQSERENGYVRQTWGRSRLRLRLHEAMVFRSRLRLHDLLRTLALASASASELWQGFGFKAKDLASAPCLMSGEECDGKLFKTASEQMGRSNSSYYSWTLHFHRFAFSLLLVDPPCSSLPGGGSAPLCPIVSGSLDIPSYPLPIPMNRTEPKTLHLPIYFWYVSVPLAVSGFILKCRHICTRSGKRKIILKIPVNSG